MNPHVKPGLVSVVVPTYNRAYCVGDNLRSVLGQTYANIEVLVVDDASRDGTPALVRAIRDPRVRYLRFEENRGFEPVARDGVERARGAYVIVLDSDDVLADASVVEHAVRTLERMPDDVWVADYMAQYDPNVDFDLAFDEKVVDITGFLMEPRCRRDLLHVWRRPFVDAFLELYREPHQYRTSKLEVCARHGCRHVVVPRAGKRMGFYGDNLSRGSGARWELRAEQATLHWFRFFSTFPAIHHTPFWRHILLSTVFWALAGQTQTPSAAARLASAAMTHYRRSFGLDWRVTGSLLFSLLPFGLPRRLRMQRLRRRNRRYAA